MLDENVDTDKEAMANAEARKRRLRKFDPDFAPPYEVSDSALVEIALNLSRVADALEKISKAVSSEEAPVKD